MNGYSTTASRLTISPVVQLEADEVRTILDQANAFMTEMKKLL